MAAIVEQPDISSPELTGSEVEPTPTEPLATPEATQPTAPANYPFSNERRQNGKPSWIN
ncbi:hypothetical protein [Nostoc sp. 'Peltigera malacea cyanobiont' DB3992]|uniref:hypothetical protein n=1 Tax=Nostoc sp. 'Peltigera malacea cyanobiont' DB3992 TaxID=1206980 RepID=UPI0015D47BDF|nr:hypothetical protein [Nostoc sp. 'Peltigera malacea cyanobiont' DB3992]